jgi:hypothetical protein
VAPTLRNRLPPPPEPSRRGHPHSPRRGPRRRSGPPCFPVGRPPKSRHLASQPCAARSYGAKTREESRHPRHSLAPQGVTSGDGGLRPGDRVAKAPGGRPLRWGRPAPRRSGSPRPQRRFPQPLSPRMGAWGTDSRASHILARAREGEAPSEPLFPGSDGASPSRNAIPWSPRLGSVSPGTPHSAWRWPGSRCSSARGASRRA